MSQNVQFQADFKKLSLANKTQITLELPEDTKFEKIAQIAQFRGARIIIQFGDPQMSMDFDEQEPRQGVNVTVGPNGVVESVEDPEGEQAELTYEPIDDLADVEHDEQSVGIIDDDMDFAEEEEQAS